MPNSFSAKTLAQFQGQYIFHLIAYCLYVSTSVSISFKVLKSGSVSHEVCAWVRGTRDQRGTETRDQTPETREGLRPETRDQRPKVRDQRSEGPERDRDQRPERDRG